MRAARSGRVGQKKSTDFAETARTCGQAYTRHASGGGRETQWYAAKFQAILGTINAKKYVDAAETAGTCGLSYARALFTKNWKINFPIFSEKCSSVR